MLSDSDIARFPEWLEYQRINTSNTATKLWLDIEGMAVFCTPRCQYLKGVNTACRGSRSYIIVPRLRMLVLLNYQLLHMSFYTYVDYTQITDLELVCACV